MNNQDQATFVAFIDGYLNAFERHGGEVEIDNEGLMEVIEIYQDAYLERGEAALYLKKLYIKTKGLKLQETTMINHLEREYIFACIATAKAFQDLPTDYLARKLIFRYIGARDFEKYKKSHCEIDPYFKRSPDSEWREFCIAHPEYKHDIFEYFGFNDE